MIIAIAVMFLSALLILISAPYYLTYLGYRAIMLHCARTILKPHPALLFALSVALCYVWIVLTPIAFFAIAAFLIESPSIFELMNGKSGNGNLLMLVLLSVPIGTMGWVRLGKQRLLRRKRFRTYVARHPLPKVQFWLQDILIATLSSALAMTIVVNLHFIIKDPNTLVVVAFYEILTQTMMFFAILDACRFSAHMDVPRLRGLYLFALMFVNAFVPLPILTALAWNVWRRALFVAEIPELCEPGTRRIFV